jgi:hypothetical protein
LEESLAHLNDLLSESIDEIIEELLSREVVEALYVYLQKVHSVSKDDVPYKLETLCTTLEKTFGFTGSRTISKAIARRFYSKLTLPFHDNPGRTLLEYVEEAKTNLSYKEGEL